MYRIILLTALFPGLTIATKNIKKCDDEPYPNSIEVVGCYAAPCDMIRGSMGQTILNLTIRE